MVRDGIDHKSPAARGLIKKQCGQRGWTLCIGAGTSLTYDRSRNPFPAWNDLAVRLMRAADPALDDATADALKWTFSPDALIQAAHNASDDSRPFGERLADTLYCDLRATLGDEWQYFASAMVARRTSDLSPPSWQRFLDTVRRHYPCLTALGLAEILAPTLRGSYAPRAIFSFNAEPLFYALLTAFSGTCSDKQVLDRITRSISAASERIPYYYCHGLLPVPGSNAKVREPAIDKLVFSEGEYLRLANSNFSWQSTSFLFHSASTSIIFLGVSMTDPNMRRWLSWVHDNRLRELHDAERVTDPSTTHYWIHQAPPERRRWIEAAVAHLGIRMVWLDAWSDVAPLFAAMLA